MISIRCFGLYFILILLTGILPVSLNAQNQHKIDSLRTEVSKSTNDSSKIILLVLLSQEYSMKDFKLALSYAEDAVSLAGKAGIVSLQIGAELNAGRIAMKDELMDLTAKHFNNYLELNKAFGTKKDVAYSYFNLGAARLLMSDYDKAEVLHLKALNMLNEDALERKDSICYWDRIIIYNNLAQIYTWKKELQKASDYYEKGISLANQVPNNEDLLIMLTNNLGDLLIEQNKFSEALIYLNKSEELRKKTGDKSSEPNCLKSIGQVYEQYGDLKNAFEYYNKGYKLSAEMGGISLIKHTSEALYKLYQKTGKADSALKYLSISTKAAEKIKKDKAAEEMTRQEISEEFAEKQKAEQKIARSNNYKYLLVLSGVIILSIIFFFWMRREVGRIKMAKINLEQKSEKLENDKTTLENDLQKKKKELTTQAIQKIQKNEIIDDVYQKLLMHNNTSAADHQKLISTILGELKKTQEDLVWEEFETRFQQVHTGFYTNLQKVCPTLTPNEKRLSAFLHLNMSSKEILNITGQTIRSIEMARIRLRKKLNLTNSSTSLTEFLDSL